MFLTTAILTIAKVIVDALLTALSTRPAAGILVTPHVSLYTNDYVPQPTDVVGAYTEASFTGYASAALTLTGPINTGPTTQGMIGTVTFTMSAVTAGTQTVYGYFLSDGAGNFQGAEKFAAQQLFVNPGDTLVLNVVFPLNERVPITQ